jgi:hypothetical protein
MAILFFNLGVLETAANTNPEYLVKALQLLSKGVWYPKNSRDKFKPIPNLAGGSSFLLNPEVLFNNRVDVVYLAQYVKLAGRRDYNLYKLYGIKTLDLSMYPDLNLTNLSQNPLLTVTTTHISFNYEENT